MKEKKDFYQLEKNIVALKERMDKLQSSEKADKREKVAQLEKQIEIEWAKINPHFAPLNIVQIARHPK